MKITKGFSFATLAATSTAFILFFILFFSAAQQAVAVSAPVLISLSPASVAAGTGGKSLTLNGTNFLPTSKVTYNGIVHSVSFMNSTKLMIWLAQSNMGVVGAYPVVVTNPSGGVSSPVNLAVTGVVIASPAVSFSPSSLSFGSESVATTSTVQTVTVTNTGTATLSLTSFAVTGANASDFAQTGNCGSAVAAGANCTIAVLFTPSADGARTASLSISDNAGGSPQAVSLAGTGSHDVLVSWADSSTSGVIGYYVYRGTASGAEGSTPVNSTPINGSNFTDANTTAGATYYYVVMSVAADGVTQSAASIETSATVPST